MAGTLIFRSFYFVIGYWLVTFDFVRFSIFYFLFFCERGSEGVSFKNRLIGQAKNLEIEWWVCFRFFLFLFLFLGFNRCKSLMDVENFVVFYFFCFSFVVLFVNGERGA